jgi:uncharacterized protein YbjT (DUF2867 family)
MQTMLITGPTGNVGAAVLKHLRASPELRVWKAVRNPVREDERYFDFEHLTESVRSLDGVDVLFLLRPPQLSDVARYFKPLVEALAAQKRCHVVFLSVQGAERLSFIPHAKIEKLIRDAGLPYTFIRPSYFMQNLTGTFREDIEQRHRLFIPAGDAPFLWVDADDVGRACAKVLEDPKAHLGRAYAITGTELLGFEQVAQRLSAAMRQKVAYLRPGVLRYAWAKYRAKQPLALTAVEIFLHTLPRFDEKPAITPDYRALTGLEPRTLDAFIAAHFASPPGDRAAG